MLLGVFFGFVPLNYSDPSGHCSKVSYVSGNEETIARDVNDQSCWSIFDRLDELMRDNPEYAKAWGWDAAKHEDDSYGNLSVLLGFHKRQIQLPAACRPGTSGNCAQANALQMLKNATDYIVDEMLPDAFVAGGSGNAGGVMAGIAGGEVVVNFESQEVSAFTYHGQGGGVVLKANATAYAGFIWNLKENIKYEGDFTTLTADLSLFEGGQVNFFFSTDTLPFTGGTWGFSLGYSEGAGAGISGVQTNYVCQFGCRN